MRSGLVWKGPHDLEQTLSIILGYDPTTLRERVDLRAAGLRLDELGNLRSLSALNEKTVLLRLLGRLDEAMDIANEAVRQARFTGDREQLLGARVRRAQVLQFQGKLEEAVTELTGCVDEARVHEWTALEAFAVQNRGKAHFDAGDYDAALADVTAAVFLREKLGASPAEIESSLIAVAVVKSFADAQHAAGETSGEEDGGEANATGTIAPATDTTELTGGQQTGHEQTGDHDRGARTDGGNRDGGQA